jgi:tRNA (guanine37-N1)-methyltransferase
MLCIRVPLKDAEKVKKELIKDNLLNKDYPVTKDKEFIYFSVKKKFKAEYDFKYKFLRKKNLQTDLKSSLTTKLSQNDLKFLRKSMDIIGNIAILEIPTELEKKEKLIAKEVLQINKNIKTVLKKGRHEGVYRIQRLGYLAGEKTKEAVYKENNVVLKLDVEQVYFSPRLSSERKRIMQLIKKPEEVLVMFSGCGVYPLVISKNTNAKHITGIEINPVAHNYALQNVLLNKAENVSVFLGDVRNIIPKLREIYDRIVMPLPKQAENFLDVAFKVSKKGTIIHLYQFINENQIDEKEKEIKIICNRYNVGCQILNSVKCGQAAPHIFRVCIDFQITKR